jgi:hypothetical protein
MQSSLRFLLLFSLTLFSCDTNLEKQGSKSDTNISSADTGLGIDRSKAQMTIKASALNTDTLLLTGKQQFFISRTACKWKSG